MPDFPYNLRVARKLRGLTQKQLAKDAGINANSVARLERGEINPKWKTLLALADSLKITPSELANHSHCIENIDPAIVGE